jgi:hypothetical protein
MALLIHVREHPEDSGCIGIAWLDHGRFVANSSILAAFLGQRSRNSICYNFRTHGIQTESIAVARKAVAHLPDPSKWKVHYHRTFALQQQCTMDDARLLHYRHPRDGTERERLGHSIFRPNPDRALPVPLESSGKDLFREADLHESMEFDLGVEPDGWADFD